MPTGLLMRERKLSKELQNPPIEPVYGPLALKPSPPYLSDEEIQNQPLTPQAQALTDFVRNPSMAPLNPYIQMLLNYFR